MKRKVVYLVASFLLLLIIIWILGNLSTPTNSLRYRITDLGPRGDSVVLLDINNQGDILEVRGKVGFGTPRIRSATGDSFQEIPINGFEFVGKGLNNLGQIVIGASTDQGIRIALCGLKGDRVEVGFLPSASGDIHLLGVNDLGQCVGTSTLSSGAMTPFLISAERGVEELQSRIGEPILWASDLNNNEDIVGAASKDQSTGRAWIWNGTGGITWLDPLGAFHTLAMALGVNNHQQVVGISATSGQFEKVYARLTSLVEAWFPKLKLPRKRYHAFLWEKGQAYALDNLIDSEPGWELEYAWNINDLGQIVGEGALNGTTHMFLLSPIEEPSTEEGG